VTLKSLLFKVRFIAIAQMLAALNITSLAGFSISDRAFLERCLGALKAQQNMRIEQQAHYRPSNASRISDGKGASKSAGTFSRPVKIPRRRFLRLAGPSGPSLASGVPVCWRFNAGQRKSWAVAS